MWWSHPHRENWDFPWWVYMPKHRKMCTTCCSKLLLFNFLREKANNPTPRMNSKPGRHTHLEEAGPPQACHTAKWRKDQKPITKDNSPNSPPRTTHHQGRPQTTTNQINYLRLKILAIPIDLGVIATAKDTSTWTFIGTLFKGNVQCQEIGSIFNCSMWYNLIALWPKGIRVAPILSNGSLVACKQEDSLFCLLCQEANTLPSYCWLFM
jgi:hypothetical protein